MKDNRWYVILGNFSIHFELLIQDFMNNLPKKSSKSSVDEHQILHRWVENEPTTFLFAYEMAMYYLQIAEKLK